MYSPEETVRVVELYKRGYTIPHLAQEMGKTPKSVIAKLSIEKVYVTKCKPKSQRTLYTKPQIVTAICLLLETDELPTLEVASKATLLKLEDLLTTRFQL